MAHRHTFLVEERQRRPNSLLLDNGNVAEDERKLAPVLKIMGIDGYDAVGTGSLDLRQADAYARDVPANKTPLVRAIPRGDALDPLASGLFVKRVRGHDLGVTSLPPAPEGSRSEKYLDAAARALRDARGRCDFLVLLSQLGLEQDKDLARRCGSQGPHLIIGNLEAEGLPGPLQVESSTIVPTGPGGIRVGIVEIEFPLMGPPRVVSTRVVPAKGDGPTDGPVLTVVTSFYAEEQKRFLKGIDNGLLPEKMGDGAGDAERCGGCHKQEVATWKATQHSRAVDSLIKHQRMVPECLVCHSTRYRDTGTFDHAARAGDVDCTACHPRATGSEESNCAAKSTRTHGAKVCRACHTKAHSPSFSYNSYYQRVNHNPLIIPPEEKPSSGAAH